ncbi:zinc finger protein 79-like isoform X1 [Dipodomys merriami]|uniref:zinc finger protein 79-like isoform X1 n=1 Tax=Dipodomys merriami TaxID=94247 RepID=UPI003855C80F
MLDTCGHLVSVGDETSICSPILTRTPKAHTGEKPHKCRECGKAYCNPSALECHWLSHTGKKLHHCATCEKAFSKLCDLLVHERRHSGEKSYLCSKCRRAFRDAVPQCSWQEEQSVEAVPVAGKCFRLDLNFSGCTDMAGTGNMEAPGEVASQGHTSTGLAPTLRPSGSGADVPQSSGESGKEPGAGVSRGVPAARETWRAQMEDEETEERGGFFEARLELGRGALGLQSFCRI